MKLFGCRVVEVDTMPRDRVLIVSPPPANRQYDIAEWLKRSVVIMNVGRPVPPKGAKE